MKALTKTCTTIFLLFTIIAAHAHTSNSIGFFLGQPYEISTVAATERAQDITLQYVASSDNTHEVVLKTGDLGTDDLMYLLHNAEGLVMKSSRIESNQITIDLTNLAPATYFLIVSNGKVSKTFKILKKTESTGHITMGK